MGIIKDTLPQVSAAAVPTNIGSSTRSDNNAAQNSAANQPSAVVSISSNSKARVASSGSNRFVDSTFGSEADRSKKESSGNDGGKSNINVYA